MLPIVFLLLSNPAGQDWAASKPYRDGESVCTGVYDEGGVEGDESSLMTFNTILWYFYGSKFDANIDTNTIYDISPNTNISF